MQGNIRFIAATHFNQSLEPKKLSSLLQLAKLTPRFVRPRCSSLLMGTTLSAVIGLGYGRGGYAQTVVSGLQTATQALTGPGDFITADGFSVNTSAGDGIRISTFTVETSDTSFTDNHSSSISGAAAGIYANNMGSGGLSITTNGLTAGANGHGIYAYNLGADMTIDTANVTGGLQGIRAMSRGSGELSITTTGVTAGANDHGIYAYNLGADMTIDTANVTGGLQGIQAMSRGSGELSITTDGDVTGGASHGIDAYNSGTDMTINTENVTGSLQGIRALSRGSGELSITTDGDVTGGASHGIDAYNLGTDMTIDTANVTGGIRALSRGSGELSITTDGAVTGGTTHGIEARNSGTDLTIDTANVTGRADGIYAINNGSGVLSISSDGDVIGENGRGIFASNNTTASDLNIDANNVTGDRYGIRALNGGGGELRITISGNVTGNTYDGIYAYNASKEGLTLTINEGGSVSTSGATASDFTIDAVSPNGAVIVNNLGTVTGRVNLTNSNVFTNSGTWDLVGTTSNFNATGDSLVVNAGLIIAASDDASNEFSAIDNLDVFRNNPGGVIRLADGGAGDTFAINGDISAPAGAPGIFVSNGGIIELDLVNHSANLTADLVGIGGDVTLGDAPMALAFKSVGNGSGRLSSTDVKVIEVVGTSDAGAFTLAGPVEVGATSYTLSRGDCSTSTDEHWYLCGSDRLGTTAALFEAMPGIVLNGFARSETLQQRLASRVQGGSGVTLSTRGEAELPLVQSTAPWLRLWGDFADITPDNSTAGGAFKTDSWGLEAGIGSILGDHAAGNLVGGVNLRYGATSADLINPVGTASLNAEGFGIASSLTWFGNDGFYVDGTAALDFVSIDATSQGGGELLNDHDDVVYSASAEIGKRIELEGDTTLIPQAQLSWGKMRNGSLTDNLGNVVSFVDREALTSRIGLTVEQDVAFTAVGAGKLYGFGNVLHDLEGSRSATVAGTEVTQSGTGDWFELGAGFSLQSKSSAELFGKVSYREAFNGVKGDAIAVSAGWQIQW